MLHWNREHKFCGHCGQLTELSTVETAKVCPSCKARFYPRIMPAVIIAITKGDEILLAHNFKFKDGLYSLIAGFVEAGESLEETVAREIYEEIRIKVKKYKIFRQSELAVSAVPDAWLHRGIRKRRDRCGRRGNSRREMVQIRQSPIDPVKRAVYPENS